MAKPEVYEHFRPARPRSATNFIWQTFCMERRRPGNRGFGTPDVRSAASTAGLALDRSFALTMMGYGVQVVSEVAKELDEEIEGIRHGGHCGGDAGLKAAPARIVAAGHDGIVKAGRRVGLGNIVTSSLAEQVVETAGAYETAGDNRHRISGTVPLLDRESVRARAEVIDGTASGTIIANLTEDRLDSVAANEEDEPVYDIDFLSALKMALEVPRDGIAVDEGMFLTAMVARHWVTIPELPRPAGGEWNVLIHDQSEFASAA